MSPKDTHTHVCVVLIDRGQSDQNISWMKREKRKNAAKLPIWNRLFKLESPAAAIFVESIEKVHFLN